MRSARSSASEAGPGLSIIPLVLTVGVAALFAALLVMSPYGPGGKDDLAPAVTPSVVDTLPAEVLPDNPDVPGTPAPVETVPTPAPGPPKLPGFPGVP